MACVVYWVALLRGSGGLFSFAILRYPLAFSVFILAVLSFISWVASCGLSLPVSLSLFYYVHFAYHNRILTQYKPYMYTGTQTGYNQRLYIKTSLEYAFLTAFVHT